MQIVTELLAPGDGILGEGCSDGSYHSFYRRWGKQVLDLALGIPLVLLFLPVMAAVALAVLATSGQPVLYGSERLGRDGRRFRLWKFRTMVRDADQVLERWKESHPELAVEYARNFKLQNDPRITRIGRVLRKTALDELPQLWNVLCGEISLVGPRAYLAHELAPYPEVRDAVVSVRPGVTGPWQVEGRNKIPPLVRMRIDVEYVSDVRSTRDILYLLRTIKPLIARDGV